MLLTSTRFAVKRLTDELSRASPESFTQLPIRLAGVSLLHNGFIASRSPSTQYPRSVASRVLKIRSYATATPTKTRSTTTPKAGTKKKTATKVRSTKKKPKTKAKAKPKPKPKKRMLTEKGKAAKAKKDAATKVKALKAAALLDSPKPTPYSVWALLIKEQAETGPDAVENYSKAAAAKYKNLSLQDLEHYNEIVHNNKVANEAAQTKWIHSHTPEQIAAANRARSKLRKMGKRTYKYSAISDDRRVKKPLSGFLLFSQEKREAGHFDHMKITESAKLAGQDWRALSASEKKVYLDRTAT